MECPLQVSNLLLRHTKKLDLSGVMPSRQVTIGGFDFLNQHCDKFNIEDGSKIGLRFKSRDTDWRDVSEKLD